MNNKNCGQFVEIDEIIELDEFEDVYDITVEDNHNFFANGILVHNCLGGLFSMKLWQHRDESLEKVYEEILNVGNKFKTTFGSDFYGELQWNSIPEQHTVNNLIIKASKELNFELISTADSHYSRPEHWKDRILYKKMAWKGKQDNYLPGSIQEVGYELYPKNGNQMWESYKLYSGRTDIAYSDDLVLESIERTHEIAFSKIENIKLDNSVKLPSFILEEGESSIDKLIKQSVDGLKKLNKVSPEYKQRLKYELEVISKRQFQNYFLTMKKISDAANCDRLTGAARGSVGGSLVAYTLGITQVDPIRWDLPFERFLRPSDVKDYPDIDYDVARPMDFKENLQEKWGKFSVTPISNLNTLKAKSLIKDISKFYDIPFAEVNSITTVMLEEATPLAKAKNDIAAGVYDPTYEEIKEFSPTYRNFLNKYPSIEEHIETLIGQIRSYSRHAGGVIVLENLDEKMPLIASKKVMQTPWCEGQNVRHLEPFGFIKFDILGLATLEIFENCIGRILEKQMKRRAKFEEIKKFYDEFMHPDKIDFDDQNVYANTFAKGNFLGLFQFAESAMQSFAKAADPKCLIDIAVITSVFRPGPLSINADQDYVKAKQTGNVQFKHPILKDILEQTYGFLVFQEQIAQIAHKIGKDLSLDEGNALRKLLIKKGIGDTSEKYNYLHSKFLEGAKEKNIDEEIAQEIWQEMEYFSAYGFSKNHALAYSIISFQCAWLLTYFPEEWSIAYLENECQDGNKKEKAIDEVMAFGMKIKLPNIRYSSERWERSNKKKEFVAPFTFIKGLGDKVVPELINNRPYERIEDLLYNKNITYRLVNKKIIDILVRSGALNDLIDERFDNDRHFWHVVSELRGDKSIKTPEQFNEMINATKSIFEPFELDEKIEAQISLLNYYPINDIFNPKIEDWCRENNIGMISNLQEEKYGTCWFIARKSTEKVSKNGKAYILLEAIDKTHKVYKIFCWNVGKLDIQENSVYAAKMKRTSFGFNIFDVKDSLICINFL